MMRQMPSGAFRADTEKRKDSLAGQGRTVAEVKK